ncbi:MAG: lipoprotein N-acyltransferase Lnb domain-containing protein [Pseudobdellovibrionaceae bacterium]
MNQGVQIKYSKFKNIFSISVIAIGVFFNPKVSSGSPANSKELVQSYNEVLNKIPTSISEALRSNVEIKNTEELSSSGTSIHDISAIEKQDSKWILKISSDWRQRLSCGNFNCESELKKIIAHQLGHIFDESFVIKPRSDQEKKLFQYCAYAWPVYKSNPPPACKILGSFNKTVSDHPDFLSLVPVQTNPQEYFAEELVKYIFESEYECRYPGVYNFLSKALGPSKVTNNKNCQANYMIPQLSIGDESVSQVNIAPENVYRIDYFLADSGDDMASKWGHTMFRIVICAPERKIPSEECVTDTAYHIVIGFSAVVTDTLEVWNGLTGEYPSILTVQPLSDFVKQYNIGEDRSLVAYPMHFSKSEIKNFLAHAVDAYWNHNKRYYFLGNNCATEGLNLIRRTLQRPYSSLYLKDLIIMTPKNLLSSLREIKLIDSKEVDHKKERYQSYFPSMKENFLANTDPAWEPYWYYSSAKLRGAYNQYKQDSPEQYAAATRFLTLERTRVMRLNQKMTSWIQQQIETSSNDELRELGLDVKSEYLDILSRLRLRRSNASNSQDSYGEVPSILDIQQSLSQSAEMQKDIKAKFMKLDKKVVSQTNIKSKFPGASELKASSDNLVFYSKEIARYLKPGHSPL